MPVDIPQTFTVKVDGTPLAQRFQNRLAEARVELSFGAAGWFQLRFMAEDLPGDTIDGHPFTIGAEVTISADDAGGTPVQIFAGAVDALAVEYDLARRSMVVSGYDAQRKLSAAPRIATHLNVSYANVLSTIASNNGLSADIHSSAGTVTHPYIVQDCSDLEFVHRTALRLGMEWGIEDGKLVVRPRPKAGPIALEFGEEMRRFTARYTATEHPAAVEVYGWDPVAKQGIVATGSGPLTDPANDVPIESRSRSTAARGRTAASWGRPISSQEEGKAIAEGIARRMAAGDLAGRGEAIGTPTIVPGARVELSGVGADWNGTYHVMAAEHVLRHDEVYLTRFTVGGYETSSIVDLMGPTASASTPAGGLGTGVTIGVVTNNNNPERNYGEVKVRFPYLKDTESAWARVASVGAGAARGVMFVPEVDDEVLVAFEHGDRNRPYVLGGLWNGNDAPPLDRTDAEARKQRVLVSQTGHRMTFYDGDGDDTKNVSIVLADGATTLHLGQDKIEVIANSGKPIEVKNDKARVVLAANGDVTLAGENVSISATRDVKIEGQNVNVDGKANVKVNAQAGFEANANGTAKVQSSGMTEIKGSMVKVN